MFNPASASPCRLVGFYFNVIFYLGIHIWTHFLLQFYNVHALPILSDTAYKNSAKIEIIINMAATNWQFQMMLVRLECTDRYPVMILDDADSLNYLG